MAFSLEQKIQSACQSFTFADNLVELSSNIKRVQRKVKIKMKKEKKDNTLYTGGQHVFFCSIVTFWGGE